MKDKKAISYINTNNLIGIKAGKERETFLEIWMITINNRIFARSWGLAEKSWYNKFLIENKGQIKCGENIFDIVAEVPNDLIEMEEKINLAYIQKYDLGVNSFYAQGIIKKEHAEKTMEFTVINLTNS